MEPERTLTSRGLTDAKDRLISADDALAALHKHCGGVARGVLAVPELLTLVRQARCAQARIATNFVAFDGTDLVTGSVRIRPLDESAGGGCEITIVNWQRRPAGQSDGGEQGDRMEEIDRATAEIVLRLDSHGRVQSCATAGP